jgi:hypothetical protein
MPLEITYVSGNRFKIHDAFVTADVEMLGGEEGMAIILRTIKMGESVTSCASPSELSLIAYLGEGLVKLRRFRSFMVCREGVVVFSTDKNAPIGMQNPTL